MHQLYQTTILRHQRMLRKPLVVGGNCSKLIQDAQGCCSVLGSYMILDVSQAGRHSGGHPDPTSPGMRRAAGSRLPWSRPSPGCQSLPRFFVSKGPWQSQTQVPFSAPLGTDALAREHHAALWSQLAMQNKDRDKSCWPLRFPMVIRASSID